VKILINFCRTELLLSFYSEHPYSPGNGLSYIKKSSSEGFLPAKKSYRQEESMNILSDLGHGWHNVMNANGLSMTVVGMLIVFFSLALISTIIASLPHFLKIIERYFPEQEEEFTKNSVKAVSETEVVAAISAALCHNIKPSN